MAVVPMHPTASPPTHNAPLHWGHAPHLSVARCGNTNSNYNSTLDHRPHYSLAPLQRCPMVLGSLRVEPECLGDAHLRGCGGGVEEVWRRCGGGDGLEVGLLGRQAGLRVLGLRHGV